MLCTRCHAPCLATYSPLQWSHFLPDAQVVKYCLSARCRRATVLQHFGEQPPPPPPGGAAHCCDVCCDASSVAAALRELSTVGAQRRQRFAGGKHMLDFGGSGGGGGGSRGGGRGAPGALEFETSWATEGLDFDAGAPYSRRKAGRVLLRYHLQLVWGGLLSNAASRQHPPDCIAQQPIPHACTHLPLSVSLAEGPSRALQESDGEEDAIQGSSDDGERGGKGQRQ